MTDHPPRILGIAASLRNARWGAGGQALVEDLARCPDKPALLAYLTRQSELHLENFLQAGRAQGLDFTAISRNLQKNAGTAGLSNSEVALAAALWAAQDLGAGIDHLSLAEYFTPHGDLRQGEALRQHLLAADGLIISGPVYFGDRGSLAESLLDFIARDPELRQALQGRLYGGIAVGAKRNGGQETTLIYQMLDLLELGLLAVGNDSETTAQYGGTGHAGDVGTMHKDLYGLDTAMGLGRRVANVLGFLGSGAAILDPPRLLFLLLQDDQDGLGLAEIRRLGEQIGDQAQIHCLDVARQNVSRCIACDICPTHVGPDRDYRCIISSANDAMSRLHPSLLHHDLIVPVLVTSRRRDRLVSAYQTFVERTRYLRRSDYIWSDQVVAPLILQEAAALDSTPLRVMTSFLRHHTVMTKPILGLHDRSSVLNRDEILAGLRRAIQAAGRITAGRLRLNRRPARHYNPVGYILSREKDAEDTRRGDHDALIAQRLAEAQIQAEKRLS